MAFYLMKKYIPYLVIFLIVALAGMWSHRQYHFRDATIMSQNDTIERADTIMYSRFELVRNTYKLDIPKISRPELVYIPADSATIIYHDNVRYVTMPRQYFYTKTDDAEIWHSGIDSTIDSLNVVRKTQEITKATQPVTKRNALALGLEANYINSPYIPIYLEYERMLHKNASFYARVLYDIPSQSYGFGLGAKVSIGW